MGNKTPSPFFGSCLLNRLHCIKRTKKMRNLMKRIRISRLRNGVSLIAEMPPYIFWQFTSLKFENGLKGTKRRNELCKSHFRSKCKETSLHFFAVPALVGNSKGRGDLSDPYKDVISSLSKPMRLSNFSNLSRLRQAQADTFYFGECLWKVPLTKRH